MPPPAAESSARFTDAVLNHLPLKWRPPVFTGSNVPLKTGSLPYLNNGVNFIIQQSKAFSSQHRLAILIAGAATDVASALLIDSTLGDRVEIIAMAFDKWPQGGDSWNVKNDIRAWQVVLESTAKIVIGDAAITLRSLLLTSSRSSQLFASRGNAGKYLANLHAEWIARDSAFCLRVTGHANAWPIWDQVIVAYLLGFTRNSIYPRPILGDDLQFIHPGPRKRYTFVKWITFIDSTQLWEHFTTNLDNANRQ